ncbi:MAG TPA: hypothetical protein VEV17_03355 [Bryobacteraceae bacterium]|nr:hypothetical protein [Bryobacteraceae bacterium]
MPAPKRATADPNSITISINASNGGCPTTHVKYGEKVQWQAPSTSAAWVTPPACFQACSDTITIPAGQTRPSPACVVTGSPGSYGYSSGLGNPPPSRRVADGNNDTIIVDTSQP